MLVANDIVDLADDETLAATQHPRFDRRVFTDDERRWLDTQADRHVARWSLWAAKETVYKLLRKTFAPTVFSPWRFRRVGTLDGALLLQADDATLCCVHLIREHDCLHTWAALDLPTAEHVHMECVRLSDPRLDPSTAVRRLALASIAGRMGWDEASLGVEKVDRIPRLLRRGAPEHADITLAHHGRFIGFGCAMARGPQPATLMLGTGMLS